MSADALFFGAHPDDVELTSGGLAALLASHGHAVTLVDLTRGEAASRGTVEERADEADQAAKALGVRRENLGLPDLGIDRNRRDQQVAVVEVLRRVRPALVVAPHRRDPHPDHVEASHLVSRACYLAGLSRFPADGERFRPARLLFALYRNGMRPHMVVDVSAVWERRMDALRKHKSQFAGPGAPTYLTEPNFLLEVEARARVLGAMIGVRFGEGYCGLGPMGIHDARSLIVRAGGALTA